MPTRFLLNDREMATYIPKGTVLLDFIRREQRLTGTKIGCREGDCGACTVLVGELMDGRLRYRSMTSCLMPLGNAHGKHIVTIEGLNMADLNPVQQAIVAEGGTQCGFCTVGFVVSLAGFCLDSREPSPENAIAAMDGNICRCTGYKSLERAGARIAAALDNRDQANPLDWLVAEKFLPAWFAEIPQRLKTLAEEIAQRRDLMGGSARILGGGTDLMVQKPEKMREAAVNLIMDREDLQGIEEADGKVTLGAAVTASDLRDSPLMNRIFPRMHAHMKLVSSTPIRNMGTLGGNLVNASPIGDLTIFFLAQNCQLRLGRGERSWTLPLRSFYKGYKNLDMQDGDEVRALVFPTPGPNTLFNFEKVCKRTHLDIASVNSAARLEMNGEVIEKAWLSAGGVAPVPFFLAATSAFLAGKRVDAGLVDQAAAMAESEVAPISDARGTAAYKRLLLRQLVRAHFLELFPRLQTEVPV